VLRDWLFFELLSAGLVFAGQGRVICVLLTVLSTDTVHNCAGIMSAFIGLY